MNKERKKIKAMPIISMKNIYHVGLMDSSLKRKDSHEGSGLSISTEPSAWKRINPMTDGHVFEMKKKNNQFLDFYALTKEQEQVIIEWGVNEGYVTICPLYKFTYFDDEMDSEYYQLFEEKGKAEIEAECYEAAVEEITGFRSTQKMNEKVMTSRSSLNSLDLLATLYAEEVLDIDGVYWFETLDVYAYSAPRGVIFKEKLTSWEAVLIQEKIKE